MFCSNCGNKLLEDEVFCHKCGNKTTSNTNTNEQVENSIKYSVDTPNNESVPTVNNFVQPTVNALPKSNKRISAGIIIAVVFLIVIFIVGIVITAITSEEQPSLFEIAEEVSPLEESGYTGTYGDIIKWAMSDIGTFFDQEGDTAYLKYSGNISGGDCPMTFTLKISGLSEDSYYFNIVPYAMSFDNVDATNLLIGGGLEEIFWAYNHRDDYPTFMDYIKYANNDSTWMFKAYVDTTSNEGTQITDVTTSTQPTYDIVDKIFKEEMFFKTNLSGFGEYQSTLTLYPDGQFALNVNLYEGMGNVYGTYVCVNFEKISFSVNERDFSGFAGDDIKEFTMQISNDKLVYTSSDYIGCVNEGMEFFLCDNESVSKEMVTEQEIYPEYQYLLDDFYNCLTYRNSSSQYTMLMPYVSSEEMGYVIIDVDGNGISELIIIWSNEDNSGSIYSMFTLSNSGEIIPIVDGAGSRGNVVYELCEKNNQYYIRCIWFEKTSPNGGYEYYRIDLNQEYLLDTICSFGFDNSSEVTRWYDMNTFETLPENEVIELIDSYKTLFIEMTLFSEYEPFN